jgi:hypothetical protein
MVSLRPRQQRSDVFAWPSSDGRQLNLVMTIVGHSFSDRLQYVFHVESGKQFGRTTDSVTAICRFPAADAISCEIKGIDIATG